MMFKWISNDITPENDPQEENPCILWIWDKGFRIGYVNNELGYWIEHRWLTANGTPIDSHPDVSVQHYCYVPKAAVRKSPTDVKNT